MGILQDIIHNDLIVAAVLAWFIAQVIKAVSVLLRERRWDWSRMFGSGGMPSSHSALVVALATSVGRVEGFSSTFFAIAAALAVIVMYDAANVRLEAGKQAELLNRMVEDFYHDKHIDGEKLKELLGHTPVEVAAGAVLGALVGWYL